MTLYILSVTLFIVTALYVVYRLQINHSKKDKHQFSTKKEKKDHYIFKL